MRSGLEFFLGGQDLEMVTVRQLIESISGLPFHDGQLRWGAQASHYRAEIAAAQAAGRIPVLIELNDDLGLEKNQAIHPVIRIDHHGERAGRDVQTSLEQVFTLLKLPAEQWSREFALIAANDRGHVRAMQAMGATREELHRIRAADRAAQGITPDEEATGRQAAEAAQSRCGGRLTVVQLPHTRTATVTDVLESGLGGPGFQNLVIHSPDHTFFFGAGWLITQLKSRYPRGWWGGDLPERGFWGCPYSIDPDEFAQRIELCA